jgi:hypothetical protein
MRRFKKDGGTEAGSARAAAELPSLGDDDFSEGPASREQGRLGPANDSPALRVVTIHNVFAVRFLRPPSRRELQRIEADLRAMARQTGAPIHYFALIANTAEVPSAEEREALGVFGNVVQAVAATAHMVIEGDGFRSSLQRSVVTATHLLRGQRVSCFKDLDAAALSLARVAGQDPARLAAALARGLRA